MYFSPKNNTTLCAMKLCEVLLWDQRQHNGNTWDFSFYSYDDYEVPWQYVHIKDFWSLASFVYELIFRILCNLRTFKVWSNKNNVKNLQDNIHLMLCLYNKKWISINNANVHDLHLLSSTNLRPMMFIMFNPLEFN